jgi:hypothetical protein
MHRLDGSMIEAIKKRLGRSGGQGVATLYAVVVTLILRTENRRGRANC